MFDKFKKCYKSWRAKIRARSLMRTYYRKAFSQICLYLKTKYIAVDSVDIYIQSAPPFLAVIEQYKQKQKSEEDKAKNTLNLNLDKPLASDFLRKAQDTLVLMQEEYVHTQKQPALTPVEVLSKNNKLQKIQSNINNLQVTIEAQESILKQISPPKRKVGRPKTKNKDKDNV